MTESSDVRPFKQMNWMGFLAMLVLGLVLGVSLDRAYLGKGLLPGGKPKLEGVWVDRLGKNPIKFYADNTFEWEIPVINMSDEKTDVEVDNKRLTRWKWLDAKTIELERGYYGEQHVKWGISIDGDVLRISHVDGKVEEYRRK